MDSREIVKRAIEFGRPPRLPFWQSLFPGIPDDVRDCWEMDRQKAGWFFDPRQWPDRHRSMDDWGCGWEASEVENMGQVRMHPLADWSRLASYRPPNPRDPFYFQRLEQEMAGAGERYVVVTSHFNLIERLAMLHGFRETLEDLHLEPEKCEKVLDLILEWKLEHWDELQRRFGSRVHGLFCTDDWGSQESTLIGGPMFERFFLPRYRVLVEAVHAKGWHFLLHSCGRVNDFLPHFIAAGVDVLNLQQPRAYGIRELGSRFAGKICFLTTADIQKTLPSGDLDRIRAEVRELVSAWSTPEGGFIVFNYGLGSDIGVADAVTLEMFREFARQMNHWTAGS
jgi:uroporphyrinogen decarboxylase